MKKSLLLIGVVISLGASRAWAGHFIDVLPPASAAGCVPVSNGYDYNCTTDSGAPAPVLAAPVSLFARTATQILALTPTTTGQALICTNCTNFNNGKAGLCISSGTTVGAWVAVSSATAVTNCQ